MIPSMTVSPAIVDNLADAAFNPPEVRTVSQEAIDQARQFEFTKDGVQYRFEINEQAVAKHSPPSVSEMLSVSSSSELRSMYEARGFTFKSSAEFVARVQTDWQKERDAAVAKADSLPLPATLQPLRVERDGVAFQVYGVVHTDLMGQEYVSSVERTISQQPGTWLFEENLNSVYETGDSKVIEMYDHLVPQLGDQLKITGLMVWSQYQSGYELIRALLTSEDRQASLHDQFPEVRTSWHFSNSELPEFVVLEGRDSSDHSVEDALVAERSAYQAAFAASLAKRLGLEEVNILVGGAHAAQIAYYLEHPREEARILAMAEEHAARCAESVEQYNRQVGGQAVLHGIVFEILPTHLAIIITIRTAKAGAKAGITALVERLQYG